MQMVKKFLIVSLLIWFFILFFMPKEELYYKLEQRLEERGIKINEKKIESGIFSLVIYDATIYVQGIQLASIEKIDFFTLLLYTSLNLEGLIVDETMRAKLPTHIADATINYMVWNPLNIVTDAQGSFGGLQGFANLQERTVHLDFNDSVGVNAFQSNLTKGENGWYYETSF